VVIPSQVQFFFFMYVQAVKHEPKLQLVRRRKHGPDRTPATSYSMFARMQIGDASFVVSFHSNYIVPHL